MSIIDTSESLRAGILERLGAISPSIQRLLLIAGCALLFCLWLSRVPLIEVDETRYATASRRMIESGDYIIPYYNGNVRYEKPILIYWIQGVSMRLLGPTEFAARLPSGLGGILLVLVVHAFLLRRLAFRAPDHRRLARARGAALLGAAALATLPLFAVWTRAATTDITLTLFTTLTMLCLLEADLTRREASDDISHRKAARWYLTAAFCCGLAFLTKGPIAVLVPALTWLGYHLRQGTLRAEARRVPWPALILLFLITAAPWYAATWFRDDGAFLRQFFLQENLARYTDGGQAAQTSLLKAISERVGDSLLFLLGVFALLFPYGAFILGDLRRPRESSNQSNESFQATRRFAWIWIAVSVGFITLSKTQYPNYVQNISAAVAIIFALYLMELARRTESAAEPRQVRLGTLPVTCLLLFGAILTLFAILLLLPEKPVLLGKFGVKPWSAPYPPVLPEALIAAAISLMIVIFTATVDYARSKPLTLIGWVMAAWTGMMLLGLHGVAPLHYTSLHTASAEAGKSLREAGISRELRTVVYYPEKDLPENIIYYGHLDYDPGSRRNHTVEFLAQRKGAKSLARINALLAAEDQLLIVTDEAGIEKAAMLGSVTYVKRLDDYIVARITSPSIKVKNLAEGDGYR